MKKILIMLVLFATGCAFPTASSKKCNLGTSQEEVSKVIFNKELAIFNLWWAEEKTKIERWMSIRIGAMVKFKLKEVQFTSNYRAGMIRVIAVSPTERENVNMYITIVNLIDEWKAKSIIIGNTINKKKEIIL